MKRYLIVYGNIVLFSLKSIMEYRLNFLLQILYGPAYVLTLFLIITVVFTKTDSLANWSHQEAILMFAVFHLLYTTCILLFIQSVRYFLWTGVRIGQPDLVMTKPISTQFLLTFAKPELNQIPLILGLIVLFFHQLAVGQFVISLIDAVLFFITFVLGMIIVYTVITTYMTIGFYVTKAAQVIEFFDKVTDYSQYPTPIFPLSLRWVFFSVIPIAFFSYVPTGLLLHKLPPVMVVYTVLAAVIFIIINQFAWHQALKHYSSASS